jgi:hypothetical protein
MADVSGKFFSAKKVRTGVSPSSPGVEQGETLPPVNPPGTSLNSVGLTMPSAFAVANSPLTSNGTIAVTGAGTTDQYVRGDGSLQNFPSLTGYVPYTGATADVDLGTHDLTAERGTFANNGSSDTLTVNHTSGSGIGVKVTKGGNNEALLVTKTSGSGNAMSVVGGRTALVDLSLSSVSNATGNFLTISGGVVHQRTPSETRSDVGAQAQLNGTGFVKASGTTITYDNSTYQVTSEKGQPNGYASLDSNGKVPLTQINDALIGNVNYQGLWNASTNNPTLVNPPSSGTKGYYYIVSTAGTFASISFEVGDWIISNGSAWQKVDNTDAVSSVFGRTGNVTATNGDYNTSQVTENTNLYFTQARVSANTDVAANTAARHNAVTLGTANGLSLSTQQLSLQLASGSQNGALSSTDWNTFNSKENAITAGTTAQYFRGDKTFQTLNTAAVPESGNLYFTNARAIASVLTGYTSGAGTISAADSILSAIQKLNGNIGALVTGVSSVNGQTGAVTLTTSNIAEGTNLYFTQARVSANTDVAANTAARHAAVTLGTANGLSLNTQQLSLGLASAGVTGALSGTDWTTFNNKQAALNGTGFVKISGTTISYDNSTYLTTAAAASTYLALAGGTMTGNINWTANDVGLTWSRNTDGAAIKFISVGDGTGESYLQIGTSDNGNEAIVFTQTSLIRVQIDTDGLLKNGSSQKYVFENGGTWGIGITGNAGTVTNGVYTSRTITINGNTQDLSANRTYNVGTVTSVAALTLGTSGTDLSSSVANGTTTPVITLNVPTASAANRGALSAADWTTFNNKQNALTNPVTGTGTTNYLPKFTGASTIGNSLIFDDGSGIRIGATSHALASNRRLTVVGASAIEAVATGTGGEPTIEMWQKHTAGDNVFAYFFTEAAATTRGYLQYDRSGNRLNLVGSGNGLLFTGAATFSNLAGSGTRMVVADANGLLSTQAIGSGSITGSGTTNYLPKFTGASTIGNSQVFDNGTNVGIGTTSVSGTYEKLAVAGGISIKDNTNAKLEIGRYNTTGAQNSYIKLGANSNSLRFTNNTDIADIMELTNSGNLGLGVTPSAWYNAGNYIAFQVGNASLYGRNSTNSEIYLSANTFYITGTGLPTYITNDFATSYQQNDGVHSWYTAPSGTAGNAISFTQAMTLTSGGNLLVGTSTNTTGFSRLVLNGGSGSESGIQVNYNASTFGGFALTTLQSAGGGMSVFTYTGNVGSESYSERIRVFSDGNTFIGSSPSNSGFKLDVNGTGRFSATWGSSSSNPFLVIERSGGAVSSAIGYDNTNTRMYFGTTTNHSLAFRTNNTDVLTLASTGAATFSNNVTASGSGNIVIQAISSNNFPLFQLQDNRSGGAVWNIEGGRTLGNLQFRSNIFGNTVLELASSGAATFSNTIYLPNSIAGRTSQIEFGNLSSGDLLGMPNQTSTFYLSYGTNNINFRNDNFGEILRLSNNGAATFSSSVTASSIIRSGGTSSQYLMADGSVSTLTNPVTGTGTAGQVAYWSSGSAITGESNLFWDATNDRLGIGRNNPSQRLDILGSGTVYANIENSSASIAAVITKNTSKTFSTGLVTDYWAVIDATSGSNTRLIITSGGNVLINTFTDVTDATLNVNGNIRTAAPTGTAAENWRLGRALLATSSDPEDRWIRVQLGTRIYDILAIDRGLA